MKKIILIVLIVTLLGVLYLLQSTMLKVQLDEFLPRVNTFYPFNEEENESLSEVLSCFDLMPLTTTFSFSMRYSYYWDDGCDYRTVVEYVCETDSPSSCYKIIYEYKNGSPFIKKEGVSLEKAEYFNKNFLNIPLFNLKSVKSEPFFIYLGLLYESGAVSMDIFEFADKRKINKFRVASRSEESYNKLFKLLKEIVE